MMALAGVWLGHRLSSRIEDRRRIWSQKRDIYANLLGSLNELSIIAGSIAKYTAGEPSEFAREQIAKLGDQLYRVLREFGNARDMAHLFLKEEAISALGSIQGDLTGEGNEYRMAACAVIERVRASLIATARKELGSTAA